MGVNQSRPENLIFFTNNAILNSSKQSLNTQIVIVILPYYLLIVQNAIYSDKLRVMRILSFHFLKQYH